MTSPVRTAIVGYGYAARTFHAPLIASVPGLVLRGISTSDPGKVLADWPGLVVETRHQAMLSREDIDLVVIPTPNDTHYPLAREALLAGKHVVVDKPFTLTQAEARELTALAAERDRVLSVFHNRRWDGDFLTVRELLASGRLGRLVQFESHFDRFRPTVRARWREQGGPGSGLWADLGPHLVDQALQLFGRPEAVSVDLLTQRDHARAVDGFCARLRYARGLRVVLQATTLAASPAPRFALHGTRGSFVKTGLDPQEEALKAGQRPDAHGAWPLPVETATLWLADASEPDTVAGPEPCPVRPGRYGDFYAAVRDAILGRGSNPVPGDEAADVMAVLDLGVASHEARCELPLRIEGPAEPMADSRFAPGSEGR